MVMGYLGVLPKVPRMFFGARSWLLVSRLRFRGFRGLGV